ncbi:aspartate/glutamate racemase family protein [Mycoplasmatota bacterium]|nr:aspartate/glutamate racemase family protein [Mycoplasmatota bacterium]
MNIVVMDSGIGGLTIFEKLVRFFPNHSFFYMADKENFPYGEKTEDEIKLFLRDIIDNFRKIDLFIVACFTASTVVKKMDIDIPIITVIDVVNLVLATAKEKDIALIGTKKTITSDVFSAKFTKKIDGQEIINKIENKENYDIEIINSIKTDLLVLGCTHFNHLPKLKIKAIRTDDLFIDYIRQSLSLE